MTLWDFEISSAPNHVPSVSKNYTTNRQCPFDLLLLNLYSFLSGPAACFKWLYYVWMKNTITGGSLQS